ncbi:MAG: hypothetical protein D6809_04365 [Gammaproteobacteria bacterium]|nr:MAG: hypothetical protein D6809_04365 [Gammaproteobacteria bacterium]
MQQYLNQLPDGWTIYVWIAAGVMILIAVVFALRWAYKTDQFDEDIKYLVFDENDRDKLSPEDYAKYKQVLKEQIEKRQRYLEEKAKERAARHAKG